MAKIVGGSLIGFLSGKESGRVYSHNKAGQYTRQYVIPVNANTAAQQRSRSSFAAASSEFHNLTPAEKAAWNLFATTQFRPVHGASPGIEYSGQQAFVSLRRTARYANQIFAAQDSRTVNVPVGTTVTFVPFDETNTTPPANVLSADIQDSSNNPLPIRLGSVATSISETRENTIQLLFGSGGIASQSSAPQFLDSNGDQRVGYLLFASKKGAEQAGMSVGPASRLVGVLRPISALGTWSASASLQIQTIPGATEEAKYKDGFTTGDTVVVTLVAVSEIGQTQLVDAVEIVVA